MGRPGISSKSGRWYCCDEWVIKTIPSLRAMESLGRYLDLPGFRNLEGLNTGRNIYSQAFSNFFNAYTKSINKQQNRIGSLFQKNFKRKIIDNETYLTRIIYYIHLNPELHKITQSFENYPYSSYKEIMNIKNKKLKSQEVLNWFAGKRNYIEFHRMRLEDIKELKKYLIE